MTTHRLLIASLLSTQTACSALFVESSPDYCTGSYAAPVVDALLAVSYLVAGAVVLADDNFLGDASGGGGATLGTGVVFAGSAAYGFSAVDACRARRSDTLRAARHVAGGSDGADLSVIEQPRYVGRTRGAEGQ